MRFISFICIFFLFINSGLTKPIDSPSTHFDIKKANQEFDRMNLKLSLQNLKLEPLEAAVTKLTELSTQAENCVGDIQKKINNLDILIKEAGHSINNAKQGEDLIYLNKQQKDMSDKQSKCRLFTIRAKENIEAYKTAIAKLKQTETFTRTKPLWTLINQTIDAPPETRLINLFTTNITPLFPSTLTSIITIFLSLFTATLILVILHKTQFTLHHLRLKQLNIYSILQLTIYLIFTALLTYLLIISKYSPTPELVLMSSSILLGYVILLILLPLIFHLKKIMVLFYWYSLDSSFFYQTIAIFLGFYSAALIGQQLSDLFSTNSPLFQIYQSLFLLLLIATIIHLIHKFCKTHPQFNFIKKHHSLILRLSTLILLTCAILNIFGYYTLTLHLIISGFITLSIVFITTIIIISINKFYLFLNQDPTLRTLITVYFGYKKDQKLIELLILKIIIQLLIITIGIYLIGESWTFASNYVENMINQLLNGIQLANITIYPTRIISGLVVFCLLYLIFRAISTGISNHQQFESEEETQVAIASIFTYIGFTIALLSGLLIAGFDFTGLAIIAGALSVGIGLGLQSIVNNFVSGLILLIEKPIRPGDRINVDGIEGFVKKIRVRSTQILTTSREDVIVPNSDLITRRVTNYMLSDKFCKICCEVGVAYDSDITLVQNVLLQVANAHEEVIKSARNKPNVLFRAFGDSNLIFQLWCLIKDVNKKLGVTSELNIAINNAFRENNIAMSFPQREFNLKLTPSKHDK